MSEERLELWRLTDGENIMRCVVVPIARRSWAIQVWKGPFLMERVRVRHEGLLQDSADTLRVKWEAQGWRACE